MNIGGCTSQYNGSWTVILITTRDQGHLLRLCMNIHVLIRVYCGMGRSTPSLHRESARESTNSLMHSLARVWSCQRLQPYVDYVDLALAQPLPLYARCASIPQHDHCSPELPPTYIYNVHIAHCSGAMYTFCIHGSDELHVRSRAQVSANHAVIRGHSSPADLCWLAERVSRPRQDQRCLLPEQQPSSFPARKTSRIYRYLLYPGFPVYADENADRKCNL